MNEVQDRTQTKDGAAARIIISESGEGKEHEMEKGTGLLLSVSNEVGRWSFYR